MTKTAIKPVFKANDDSEHPTAAAAERQNKVLAAEESFHEACKSLVAAIKERATTADGEPFTSGRSDYWWFPSYSTGLPELHRLSIYPYLSEVGQDYKSGKLLVKHREYYGNGKHGDDAWIAIDELYANERKAQAAHLKACKERIAELQEQVTKIEARYEKDR